MEFERIYLSTPHMSGDEIIYVKDAFDSNWVAPLGPHVEAFERETARYAGVEGALALSSGTAALHLISCLMGINRGTYIFCSSLTFAATVGSLYHGGVESVFIDSEPTSWNMSPSALRRAFENAEKSGRMPSAVLLVNLYGQSCDMDPIREVCAKYGTPIIEDAAYLLAPNTKERKQEASASILCIHITEIR